MPTITLKKLNLNVNWHLSTEHNDNTTVHSSCTICKNSLMAPTPKELASPNYNVSGNVLVGGCGHSFHEECIKMHLTDGCLSCPCDMTPWNTASKLSTLTIFDTLQQTKFTIKSH